MKVAFVSALLALALCVVSVSACNPIGYCGGTSWWWMTADARDDFCPSNQVCSRSGSFNMNSNYRESNTGACSAYACCHSVNSYTMKEGDRGCYKAGSSRQDRDNKCQGELVCARYGYDGRYYGCSGRHCCSKLPGKREMVARL